MRDTRQADISHGFYNQDVPALRVTILRHSICVAHGGPCQVSVMCSQADDSCSAFAHLCRRQQRAGGDEGCWRPLPQ